MVLWNRRSAWRSRFRIFDPIFTSVRRWLIHSELLWRWQICVLWQFGRTAITMGRPLWGRPAKLFVSWYSRARLLIWSLFTTYVRPVLEYASQVWSPSLIKNIDKIESVQRYFTRRILENVNVCYLDRLQRLQIDTLGQRRIEADLVDTDINEVFTYRNNSILRGHSSQLHVEFSRTERRQSFYCNRIVSKWNTLPQEVVNSPTTLAFKRHLQSLTFTGRGSIFSSV